MKMSSIDKAGAAEEALRVAKGAASEAGRLAAENIKLRACIAELERECSERGCALRMVLLFHGATPWTVRDQEIWQKYVQSADVTTKSLSDYIRKTLGEE